MPRIGSTKLGLWKRIKRLALTDVGALVRGLKADDLEQLEQTLIEADFGVPATLDLVEFLEAEVRRGKLKTDADLRRAFADRLAEVLAGPAEPGTLAKATTGPTVVLIIGVNGAGKTTSVAKLAHRMQAEGRSVLLGAADTWRATMWRRASTTRPSSTIAPRWPPPGWRMSPTARCCGSWPRSTC